MHHPELLPWCRQLSQARPKNPTWQQQTRKPNPVAWPPQQPQQCHPHPQHHHIHCEESLQPPDAEAGGTPLPWCTALIPSQWSWWPCGTQQHTWTWLPKGAAPAPADPSGCHQICRSKTSTEASAPLCLPISLSSLPSMETSSLSLPSIFKTD